ncbi:MAG: anaerobic sulfatase maturase [Bryobacteraceae bacterium]
MSERSPFPVLGGAAPRIESLLIKPASAVCNLDCAYCFYLDREADPYRDLPGRSMDLETLERVVDTWLFYSYPNSSFAFQGGEPTLAGLRFFEKLVEFQQRHGRDGQSVSNSLQTNGILINEDWCALLKQYQWLVGLSLDGPEETHDRYRLNRGGSGTWKRVMRALETLQRQAVDYNILCVVSQANVEQPKELYRFFRSAGADNLQFIPLAEFDPEGNPLPFTITPEQYGRFLLELFELWWPERRKVRMRWFDNVAEAIAGLRPGNCTLHETCDSYVVVEYNGDVYPCDFFVSAEWKLGNIRVDSWPEIARRRKRYDFAAKKALPHPECQRCEHLDICHGGCPKLRHGRRRDFHELDYFCQAYKMAFARIREPLAAEVRKLLRRTAQP